METYTTYKGYGIAYSSITGTTTIYLDGQPLKQFRNLGEMNGKAKAIKSIDTYNY